MFASCKREFSFKGDKEKPKNGPLNNLSQLDNIKNNVFQFNASPLIHDREQSFRENGLCLKRSSKNTVKTFRFLQGLENSENTFFSNKTVDQIFEAKSFGKTVGTSVEKTSPFLRDRALSFPENSSENRVKSFLFPQDTEKSKKSIFLKEAVDEAKALKKTISASVKSTSAFVEYSATSSFERNSENTVKPFLFPQGTEKSKNSIFLKEAVDEAKALKKTISASVKSTSAFVEDNATSSLERNSENTVKPFLFFQGSAKSENPFFPNKVVDQNSAEKDFENTVSTSVENTSPFLKDGERTSLIKGTENTVKPFLSFKVSAKNENFNFSNETVDQTSKANTCALLKPLSDTSSSIQNFPPFVLDCVRSFHEECSEDRKKIFRLCERLKINENSPCPVKTVDQTFGTKDFEKTTRLSSSLFTNPSSLVLESEQKFNKMDSEDTVKLFLSLQNCKNKDNVPHPYKVTQHISERSSVENAMKNSSTIGRRSKSYSLRRAVSRSRKAVFVDAVALDIIREQRMSWWSMDDNPPKCHSESLPNLSVESQVDSNSSEQDVLVKIAPRDVDEANNKLMNSSSYDNCEKDFTVLTPGYMKHKTKPLEKSSSSDYDSRIFAKAKEGKNIHWRNKFNDESELDDLESSLDGSFRHYDSYDASCSDSSEDLSISCKPIKIPNTSKTFEEYSVPCESGLKETTSMSDGTLLESHKVEHPDIFFVDNGTIVFGLIVLLCLSIYNEDLKLFLHMFS